MAQKHRFHQQKRGAGGRRFAPQTSSLARPPEILERPAAIVYGKPFIVLEDKEKNTFVFKAGEWIAHSESIAQCRETCQVKQLPQPVNNMIRYEIRCPV